MLDGDRYVITLTSSRNLALPRPRVIYRGSDQAAIDAAKRELRRWINIHGLSCPYDGWRLRKSIPGRSVGQLVAEVRPGYDSRKVDPNKSRQPGAPPF